MDIRIITAEIGKAKELIQSVMEGLRAERKLLIPCRGLPIPGFKPFRPMP